MKKLVGFFKMAIALAVDDWIGVESQSSYQNFSNAVRKFKLNKIVYYNVLIHGIKTKVK